MRARRLVSTVSVEPIAASTKAGAIASWMAWAVSACRMSGMPRPRASAGARRA